GLTTDQRVPADRPADDTGQRRADRIGAAGQIAGVEAPPVFGRLSRRNKFPLGHGGGGGPGGGATGGPGAGPTGAGGPTGTVVGGPIGIVMPGATSIVGWITVSDGGATVIGVCGFGACGT